MNLLVDIDRTLSDAAWREPLIDSDGWEFYHKQSVKDSPIIETVRLLRALYVAKWRIIGLTARPEWMRPLTVTWLMKFEIPIHDLFMRGNEDFRPSPHVKISLSEEIVGNADKSRYIVIDDREDICLAFRDAGYVAMQVHRLPNHVR